MQDFFPAVWFSSNSCSHRRWDDGFRGRTWREINSSSCEEQLHQLLPNSWKCCHRTVHHPTLCETVWVHVERWDMRWCKRAHLCVYGLNITTPVHVCETERERGRQCVCRGGHDLHLAKLIVWAWNCLTSPQSSTAKSHTIGCFQLQPDNSTGITQREGEGRGRGEHGRHIHETKGRKDANRQLDGRRAERKRVRPQQSLQSQTLMHTISPG